MVIIVRNEGARPGANTLGKCVSDRLVWKEEGDAMRMEGGDFVAFNDCESMYVGLKVGLCVKTILCDVDRNDNIRFVSGKDFLKEKFVFSRRNGSHV